MAEAGRRKRRWFRRIVAIVLSTIVALLLGEVAVRIVGYRAAGFNQESEAFWRYDKQLGWHHRPNVSGSFSKPQFSTTVRINSQGLRDREYSLEKPDGVRRVLVLGDSFAWGFGVEQEEIFCERMESELQRTEFINAGVSGYGTDQELLWLEKHGLKYQPDELILLVSGNDPHENTHDFVYGKYYKPVFNWDSKDQLIQENIPVPRPSWFIQSGYRIRQYSALGNLATDLGIRVEQRFLRSRQQLPQLESTQSRPIALTVALIKRLKQVAAANDIKLRIAVHKIYWFEYPDGRYEDFVASLSNIEASVIDLHIARGYTPKSMQIKGDNHWNAAGHAFVAKLLLEKWYEQGKTMLANAVDQ